MSTLDTRKSTEPNPDNKRKKFECPVIGCGLKVYNLSRHLHRKPHNWSLESARAAMSVFVKENNQSKKNKKDYHASRICPVDGCCEVVKRLPRHLMSVHKLQKTREYYELLKCAKTYYATLLPQEIIKSPRKVLKSASNKRESFSTPIKVKNKLLTEGADKPHSNLLRTPGNGMTYTQEKMEAESALFNAPVSECIPDIASMVDTGEVSDNPEIQECDELSENNTSLYSPSKDPMFNFKEVVLSKEIEQIFKDFHVYLIGPDGGSRKESGTKQVVDDGEGFVA